MDSKQKINDLALQIKTALKVVFSEGSRYLSEKENDKLISELSKVKKNLDKIGIKDITETMLQPLAKISDESIYSIYQIAQAKFLEEENVECLALFSFLCHLNPDNAENWFRLGVAAQQNENFEMASRAYAAALMIDPKHVGAKIFSAECFAERNLYPEAKKELAAAKKLIKDVKTDQMWVDLLPVVEVTVNQKI